jgi:hypothetical protein
MGGFKEWMDGWDAKVENGFGYILYLHKGGLGFRV